MTGEMIGRVAKAMQAETVNKPFSWDNAARAAIEAMREPTAHMMDAGFAEHEKYRPTYSHIIRRAWMAMIDAALASP